MSQAEIDRAVAKATGESLGTIRGRGFSLITSQALLDPEELVAQPQVVDWDQVEAGRSARAA